ncbi:MAG: RNA-binding transcriptional accessory protein [Firmicutes bacterium]|nr:RNA-binding transcriptional accessory protein [Bacillota bacterium]
MPPKELLAQELELKIEHVANAIELLDQGNTVPFIARYRKELTGEMDESMLRQLQERLQYLRSLAARQQEVKRLIAEQGLLTAELAKLIDHATTLQQVEDVYLPYCPKRRTRATIAKEKGLEPLADSLMDERLGDATAQELCQLYVDPDKGVESAADAMAGAQDIIAERVSENYFVRELSRNFFRTYGDLTVVASDQNVSSPYEMYYEYTESIRRIPPHRVLAINRGEREGLLKVTIQLPQEQLIERILLRFTGRQLVPQFLREAVTDGCRRLLFPSIEREIRNSLTEVAEEQAIKVFAENLRNLLLQAPVKGKIVLAIDPAYRTGCKLAVLNPEGRVLDTAVAYITPPQNNLAHGRQLLLSLIEKHRVDLIAIGNGTGSRETEEFVAELIGEQQLPASYTIVNEAGASVYSASPLAAEELPQLDVTLRGAVSIGRRLQDPLAELVKIDPKSIGVGQYQHDVNQKRLAETLQGVVEDVVNSVGVDLNTASPALLSYVAGVSKTVAKNIVSYRDEHGPFSSRQQLLQVPRLGPATFLQCAGFCRIPEATDPLDNTSVHPESYPVARRLMPLMQEGVQESDLAALAKELDAGLPTLRDIYAALLRPGRDPREDLPGPVFRRDVLEMEDLTVGMILPGVVRNVVDFGVFVDIGVKQDGLVHISEISDNYVKHPADVLQVGEQIMVRVLAVDLEPRRISLSAKGMSKS